MWTTSVSPSSLSASKPAATHRALKGGALDREREVASERTDAAANAATNLIRTTHELGPKPHKASAGNGLAQKAHTYDTLTLPYMQ